MWGGEGRAGLRWVGPRVGAAGLAALVHCRPDFGCVAVGWADGSVGPIVVLGPIEGSDFLSVGGFGQSEE